MEFFYDFLSFKYFVIIFYVYSILYIHLRGQEKLKFRRQLFQHTSILAPLNVIFYIFSAVPRTPFIDLKYFPELEVIKKNWETISLEAINLFERQLITSDSERHDDAGFHTFFKKGWRRFYIKWYGDYHESAKLLCPQTISILENVKNLNAAMFAVIPPGGKLNKHRDPYSGSLRYHLGLSTPNSDDCFICVDNAQYSWRDGEGIVFDETYVHWVENNSNKHRLILFCDIERPVKWKAISFVNYFFKISFMRASASPNLAMDSIGLLNKPQ
jgi:beta-hydroxylase